MFQQVADLLTSKDLDTPFTAYASSFNDWKEETEIALDDMLEASEVDFTEAEAASFAAVKDIGFGLLKKFVERGGSVGWASRAPEVRKAAAQALLALPQIPQRTAEWYAQGKQVLTASEFATLFKTPRAVSQLVLSKAAGAAGAATTDPAPTNRLACLTCEMGPFDWGIRFEPVVKQVLEAEGITIAESGRLLHPSNPNLAASPDGIVVDATDPQRVGRLIEIKCPISRKVGEGIPFEYWCQMQIQMEVTGIGECEYIEVKIQSKQKGGEGEPPPEATGVRGTLWLLQNQLTAAMQYAYTEETREEMVSAGWEVLETIPWRIDASMRKVVSRDRGWFEGTRPLQEKFWVDVAAARRGEYTAVPSSRPPRKPAAASTAVQQMIVIREGHQGAAGYQPQPPTYDFLPDESPPEPSPVEVANPAPSEEVGAPPLEPAASEPARE
jgi:hypothetical protein